HASFPDYTPVPAAESGRFRLVVGRVVLHTHVSTQNNPYLHELFPENALWINAAKAAELGIKNDALVEVTSPVGSGVLKAYVTDLIHPEAVFLVHGFGHEAKLAARCYNRGVSDSVLQENITDKVGGSPAFHDTFVTVKAA
nr:molybdopterin dinucleotide binding domain-containing protein [Desulfobacterales bacterium]